MLEISEVILFSQGLLAAKFKGIQQLLILMFLIFLNIMRKII